MDWFRDESASDVADVSKLEFRSLVAGWASGGGLDVEPSHTLTIWLPGGPVLGIEIVNVPKPSVTTFYCGYFPAAQTLHAEPSFSGYLLDGDSPWDVDTTVPNATAAASQAITWFEHVLALPLEVRTWPGKPRKHIVLFGEPPRRVSMAGWWWPTQANSDRLERTRIR
jgi:hypothetical protein